MSSHQGAMNELNEFFVDPEGQTCGGFDACGQQTHITQACFQRPSTDAEREAAREFLAAYRAEGQAEAAALAAYARTLLGSNEFLYLD